MLVLLRTRLVLPAVMLAAFTSLLAQPGTLSTSFGSRGLLTDPSRRTVEKAIVPQDKKLLIGSQGFYQGFQTFLVDRLLPNGTKDNTFGTGGTAYFLFQDASGMGSISSQINAMALLPCGKIVAAGHAAGNGKNIAIAQLLPDGLPDESFGKNGASLTGFNMDETLNGLALQPDGKLVVCGTSAVDFMPNHNRFFVARYLPDGSIDSSFGKDGIVTSVYAGSASAVAVQPDGKIIAGGYSLQPDAIYFHIERYDANGKYDNTYGMGGVVESRINDGFLNLINDIALQPDGRLIAGGRTNGGTGAQMFVVARYNMDGSADKSFGTNGIVTTTSSGATGEVRKVMLTAAGNRILAVGNRTDFTGSDFMMASYTLAGIPDTEFGNKGVAITDFGGNDFNNSAALCPDGSIVALGNNTGQFSSAVRALAKYNGYPVSVPLFVKIRQWLQNHRLAWKGLPAVDNIVSYKVEQSANGRTGFTEVANISGASHLKEYTVTNSRILSGENYYRIKAVSADGLVKYSETVSIDNKALTIAISPNPAKDMIFIKGLSAGTTSYISIANSSGRVMLKAVSTNAAQYRMMINSLQKGTYHMLVVALDGSIAKKMFVKE